MNEEHLRIQAIQWLQKQCDRYQDVLPRAILESGFDHEGQQVRLIGAQGIWFPKGWSMPVSITTTYHSPYQDKIWDNGLIYYRYRGKDPMHRDNDGLRNTMRKQTPLIYFHGIRVSYYTAMYPVYIVGDDPDNLTFTVAVDELSTAFRIVQAETDRVGNSVSYELLEPQETEHSQEPAALAPEPAFKPDRNLELRRAYITRETKQRLFQSAFRDIVLTAYKDQCAFCRLRHRELLDAAHIIPDREEMGKPEVTNGLSLCKIHHAAFDTNIIGIRPDYVIQVNEKVLCEVDGPMLKYGIQGMHNQKIILPYSRAQQPSPERLARRYEEFKGA